MLYCYHHTDMDGKSAAHVVHTCRPLTLEDHPEAYIATDYGDSFDKHHERDDVILVDISISDATYEEFLNICKTARSVTWIDHHDTSLDIVTKHKEELQKIKNLTYFVSKCACGAALAFSFFKADQKRLMEIRDISDDEYYQLNASFKKGGTIHCDFIKIDSKSQELKAIYSYEVTLPLWLFHIDDYDCWKKQDQSSNLIQLAAECENTDFTVEGDPRYTDGKIYNSAFWDSFTSEDSKKLIHMISEGKTIMKYIESRYNKELSDTFEWINRGSRFICKNGTGNSWNFGELLKLYPAAILFNYNGKSGKWEYSIYSDENSTFDCSEFAKSFGGGGHRHASGFQLTNLIFLNKNK